MADFAPASPGTRSRGVQLGTKHKRTRSGCLCCRLRRKKCDGIQPTCTACERNVLICSWPASKATRQEDTPQNAAGNVFSSNSTGLKSNRETLAQASQGAHDYRLAETFQDGKPQHLQCHVSRALLSQTCPSAFGARMELVYRNYVTRTANTVSALQDSENPFINILLPLAESNSMILDSLLALSAAHLWKQPARTPDAEQWMITHEMLAVRGLKHGLTSIASKSKGDSPETSVGMIFTTLLLCLVEAMKGESNLNATFHLKGSRTILYQWISTEASAKDPRLRAFIIELYLYLTISIGVPLGLEMEPYHFVAQDAVLLFPYVVGGKLCGPLLGCAHELFEIIPQIHILAHSCSAHRRGLATSLEINTTFRYLLGRLLVWKPPQGSTAEFISCAKVYQQALLVFLVSSNESFTCQSSNVVDIFDQAYDVAIYELQNLPFDSPTSTTLTWPLAVLGASASEPEHQQVVRTRLMHLSQNLHFAVFDQVLSVLEALWADESKPKGMVGFKTVMRNLKMHVLIS